MTERPKKLDPLDLLKAMVGAPLKDLVDPQIERMQDLADRYAEENVLPDPAMSKELVSAYVKAVVPFSVEHAAAMKKLEQGKLDEAPPFLDLYNKMMDGFETAMFAFLEKYQIEQFTIYHTTQADTDAERIQRKQIFNACKGFRDTGVNSLWSIGTTAQMQYDALRKPRLN